MWFLIWVLESLWKSSEENAGGWFVYSSLANMKSYVWGITVFCTDRREMLGFQAYYTASDLSYDHSVVGNQSPHRQTEGNTQLKGQNKIDKALKKEKMRSVKAKGCQLLPTFRSWSSCISLKSGEEIKRFIKVKWGFSCSWKNSQEFSETPKRS